MTSQPPPPPPPTSPPLPLQDCFGYAVAALDEAAQVRAIQQAIDERRGLRALQINVANLHAASRDAWLAAVFRRADLLSAEGRGLYFGSRVVGPRLAAPVTGIGIMQALLAEAAARGDRVFLLGARPEVLAAATAAVVSRCGDIVAGGHHGYYETETQQQAIAEAIRASGATLVLAGMSTPKKEAWIDRWAPLLGVPHVGVGGSFDVLAGRVRLAPPWMRAAGLEWAFRLAQEPRRLAVRYLRTNLWFLGLVGGRIAGRGARARSGR